MIFSNSIFIIIMAPYDCECWDNDNDDILPVEVAKTVAVGAEEVLICDSSVASTAKLASFSCDLKSIRC